MTKVDIFSGFLGAGKTTLIRKLIEEAYGDEKIVLIENEFGEIGVDKSFLKNTGIKINEMNAGCICCTLVGDFGKALNEVIEQYDPDRILIEPSGVGKLSDVIIAVQDLQNDKIVLNGFTTVVDATKAAIYMDNFGEFYENQIEHASSIILSHTKGISQKTLDECLDMIHEHNTEASVVTTDWDEIDGSKILGIMEEKKTLSSELEHLREEAYIAQMEHEAEHDEHEHHHHHETEQNCGCNHHHGEDEQNCCCHEHHHDGEHEHHHHGHHADEVFDEMGIQTAHFFKKEQLENALSEIEQETEYGMVLRAKGFVAGENGQWYEFDYIPGEPELRAHDSAETTGVICVIGVGLKKEKIKEIFGI